MVKLTNKEKRILAFIVTNCELYYLNESEAMVYIEDNLGRPVSRRTYYYYKRRIYRIHEKYSNYSEALKMSHPLLFKKCCKPLLAVDKITMFRNGLKEKINLEKYDRLTFIPHYFKVFESGVGKSIESLEKSISNLESNVVTVNGTSIPFPANATVREEFVKCGKLFCHRCPHGPYYYAYWRDENRKLRKKYLGTNKPRTGQEKPNSNLLSLIRKQKSNDNLVNLIRKYKKTQEDELQNNMFRAQNSNFAG